MKRLRILLLAPQSNPNSITGPLIGYRHGLALAQMHEVTLVVEARNEEAIRAATSAFHGIEAIEPCWVDRLRKWVFRYIFKEDRGNLLLTAISFPVPIAFEMRAWRRLRSRLRQGEFDVVLRILPIVPMMPSPFAYFLRKGPVPFVIGPLNGGVPWPKGFSQIQRQRAEAGNWVARFRNLYWHLPFARATYAEARAIIAGASHTCHEFHRYSSKVFFVPGENGVDSRWLDQQSCVDETRSAKLELVFVGRLVPYKACDLALRGAAALLREGRAHLHILGEGPEAGRFAALAAELGVQDAVTFCGMVKHAETLELLRKSDVLVFPSLREFGGGVVFEALATGTVPVVAWHGGPGDIVNEDVGFRIPLTNEQDMATRIEAALRRLDSDRSHLRTLQDRGMAYAREHLTWEAKARMVSDVLLWATGNGPKPVMPPPSHSCRT